MPRKRKSRLTYCKGRTAKGKTPRRKPKKELQATENADKKSAEMDEALNSEKPNYLSKGSLSSYNLTTSAKQMNSRSSEHLFACINELPAYKCSICNFTSDLKVNLIDHAVQVHNLPKMKHNMTLIMKKLECQSCNLQTYSFLLFKLHHCNPRKLKRDTKTIENKEIGLDTNMKRRQCLYTTKDYFLRISQEYACKNVLDLYKCKICDFTTDLHVLLKNHMLKAHKAPLLFNYFIENFTCNVCNFQTFSLLILYDHVCTSVKRTMENRMVEHNKWYYCTLCSQKSKSTFDLKLHFRRKHPYGTMFKCNICKFTFVDRSDFERHLKICKFISKYSNLKMHLLNKHEDDHKVKWFLCEHCDYKSKFKRSWKRHLNNRHSSDDKVKGFGCKHCNFKCKVKHRLTLHLERRHPGKGNIHLCTYCEYKFSNRTKLKNHLLEEHREDKWFHRKHCEYKIIRRASMRTHKHTEDKEFKCELCEGKFKNKRDLKMHVWTLHIVGDGTYPKM